MEEVTFSSTRVKIKFLQPAKGEEGRCATPSECEKKSKLDANVFHAKGDALPTLTFGIHVGGRWVVLTPRPVAWWDRLSQVPLHRRRVNQPLATKPGQFLMDLDSALLQRDTTTVKEEGPVNEASIYLFVHALRLKFDPRTGGYTYATQSWTPEMVTSPPLELSNTPNN